MKSPLILAIALAALEWSLPVKAENLSHLNQLLSSKQCPNCDLSRSGLVQLDLTGANLRGANLTSANLSQANLSGADLSGANLSGASLHGAILINANLSGAVLVGADLQNAYLNNTTLTGADLTSAYIQGAIGLPTNAGTPEQFLRWGMAEAERRNYQGAIAYFNQGLSSNPEFAPGYLARSIAYYRLGDETQAQQDAQVAAQLFEAHEHVVGLEASQGFILAMEEARLAREEAANRRRSGGGGNLGNALTGVATLLLRFLLP
ncbi:MAG: pentapeptide repeat-containing protein [Chloroflexaceae bacterium]|nr:pentapeptide repeat-containing protein [Chloroflexaceae bacterium]